MIRDKISNKSIIEVLYKNLGVIYTCAKKLNISRRQLKTWIDEDEELTAAYNDCVECAIDMSESKLFKNIQDGKEASVFFHLKTKGKHRGYVERHEYAEHKEQPLFEDDDNDDDGSFED